MGFFGTLFSGDAEKEAADKNRALYAQYGQAGTGYLDAGMAGSKAALDSAKGDYAPLSSLASKYTGGTDMLLNALGLNGAAGTQAAQSAYTASPGYDWQLGQGLDAISRRRAATGMNQSGNADLDALTYGQGLAKQDYGSWLSNLSGINNNALTATGTVASGLSGIDQGLANLYQQDATNRVGLQGNVTSGDAAANNAEAAGKSAGAKNLLSAGMGLASLAAGGFGGGSFGFGAGSSLGSTLGSAGITYGMPGTRTSNMFGPVS